MYLEYWGLKEKPFENTPDPHFFYPSREHREALQRLQYALEEEKGCAMLSGEYGCGKTLLARALVARLQEEEYVVAFINYPILDRESFLKETLHEFGKETDGMSRMDAFRELSRFFYDNSGKNLRNVLIIDEAQLIEDPGVFEELRLLLNIQLEDRFLVNLLLVGQPELRERVMAYPQLEQRVAIRYHLHRFEHQDTVGYVQHRLEVAGAERPIFSEEALYVIHRMSFGVPRRINNLCDLSLLEAAQRKVEIVDGEILKEVV